MKTIKLSLFFSFLFVPLLSFAADLPGQVPGNLGGSINVNKGQLQYSLPLPLPSVANGPRPSLTIGYSQGASDGIMGLGFVLSGTSKVHRCGASQDIDGFSGGIAFDSNDRFCLDGLRFVEVTEQSTAHANERQFRVQNNPLTKAVYYDDGVDSYWKMWVATGQVHTFGAASDEREQVPEGALSWFISNTEDRYGNQITYNYTNISNVNYLNTISYQDVLVQFSYDQRQNPIRKYSHARELTFGQILSSVAIHRSSNLVYTYSFTYQPAGGYKGSRKSSRLTQIQLCDAENQCQKPLEFAWSTADEIPQKLLLDETSQLNVIREKAVKTYVSSDLNNDGHNDLCYYKNGLYCGLNNGNTDYGSLQSGFPSFSKWTNSLDHNYWNKLEKLFSLTLIDINDDDYLDYCLIDDKGLYCGMNNNGTSFHPGRYVSPHYNIETAVRYVDLQGDGQPDLCRFEESGKVFCSVNNKGNFAQQVEIHTGGTRFLLEYVYRGNSSTRIPQPQFIDMNADGYQDICGFSSSGDYTCHFGRHSDQNSIPDFSLRSVWSSELPITGILSLKNPSSIQVQTVEQFTRTSRINDVNGDRLADICYRQGSDYLCQLNDGTRFLPATSWLPLPNDSNWGNSVELKQNEAMISLQDRNGDDLIDFCSILAYHLTCAYNTGDSFSSLTKYMEIYPDIEISSQSEPGFDNGVRKLFNMPTKYTFVSASMAFGPAKPVQDLDGNTTSEDCYRSIDGITCGSRRLQPIALLKQVTDSYGASTKIDYAWTTNKSIYTNSNYRQGDFFSTTPNLLVVSRLERDNGVDNFGADGTNSISYTYQDYMVEHNKGVRGFRQTTNLDHVTNTKVTTGYLLGKRISGRVNKVVTTVNGNKIGESNSEYVNLTAKNSKLDHIVPSREIQSNWELDGTLGTSTEKLFSDYSEHGKPQTITDTISSAQGESFTTVTKTQYSSDESRWLLNLPTKVEVKHTEPHGHSVTKVSTFRYDTETAALLEETLELNHPLARVTQYSYDSQGNLLSTSIGGARTSTSEYNALGQVTSNSNALGHSEQFTYNAVCGTVQSHTGPNDLTTSWEHDSFCRKIKELRPDGSWSSWSYAWSDGANAGIDPHFGLILGDRSSTMVSQLTSTGQSSATYYDMLGREVRSITTGSKGKRVVTDKAYNKAGLLVGTSLPYFKDQLHGFDRQWIINRHDLLGRVIEQSSPQGKSRSTTHSYYKGLVTRVESDNGIYKQTTSNAKGQAVKIEENGDSIIAMQYDAAGNLISTNTNGFIVTLQYDLFGNKTAMADPSVGQWSYTYNRFGEIVAQTDSKGQTSILKYDVLGRMIQRNQGTAAAHWLYDTADNAIGKLVKESNDQYDKQYSYDSYGRIENETLNIDGKSFTTSYVYNQDGRLEQVIKPDDFSLHYAYDKDGSIQSVSTPKNAVFDYNYERLTLAYEKVATQILEIETKTAERRQKLLKYQQEITRLTDTAVYFHRVAGSYVRYANNLFRRASSYHQKSMQYKRIADSFARTSNDFRRTFGNMVFRFMGYSGSKLIYRNQRCSGGKRRRCRSNYAQIPRHLVNYTTRCYWQRSGKRGWRRKCYTAPQRYINPANHYAVLSSRYRRYQSWYAGYARRYQRWGSHYSRIATYYRQQAQKHLVQAKQLTKEGESLSKEIAGAVDQLERLKGESAALQKALAERENDSTHVVLWQATARKANGQLLGEIFMNGVSTHREYDSSGRPTAIKTAFGKDIFRDLRYSYDRHNNVTNKQDATNNSNESYGYDDRNRLTSWNYQHKDQNTSRQYAYDIHGNITRKTGAGTMSYDQGNRLVSRQAEDGTTHNYSYDANGNMLNDGSRSFIWTGFNKISTINYGTDNLSYSYDANRSRIKQITPSATTWYASGGYEAIEEDQYGVKVTRSKHHIMVDGQVVSTYERTQIDGERQADNVLFMHRDILGNADRITDSQGKLVMSRNFTPYGEELPEQVASPEGVEDDSTVKTKVYQRIEAALASDASGDLIDTALYNRYRIGQQQLSSYKHFNKEITSTEEAATDQSTDGSSTTEAKDISDDTVAGVEQALANLQATPQMAISEIDLSQEIGKLKQTEEKLQLGNTIAKSRQRGYTGHEHIKEVGLINMNARLYDPVIARFISADSKIPEPGMSQAYNRYVYTIGNPVKYTDPDGHWWLFAAGLVMYLASQTIVEDPQLAQAMAIAGIVMMGAGAGGVTGLSGGASAAAANGALVGGTMGFLNSGGAVIEGAKGAVIGGVTGAATYNIGHGSGGNHVAGSNVVAQAATHGVVQGVISEASGGNFRTGFIGGATGHVAGKATQGVMQGDTTGPAVAARTSIAAIFGGTAAHVTGGNFGQGAYHAAMVHLFNGEMANVQEAEITSTIDKKGNTIYTRGKGTVIVNKGVVVKDTKKGNTIADVLTVSENIGETVHVISGHRTKSATSEHYRVAVDLYVHGQTNATTPTLRDAIHNMSIFNRVASYHNKNTVHVDYKSTRNQGRFHDGGNGWVYIP